MGWLQDHQVPSDIDMHGGLEATVVVPANRHPMGPVPTSGEAVATGHLADGFNRRGIREQRDETALFESINQLREVVRFLGYRTQTGVRERCFYRGPNIPFLRERHRLGQTPHLRWTEREILMREHLLPRGHLSRQAEAPVVPWCQRPADAIAHLHGQLA